MRTEPKKLFLQGKPAALPASVSPVSPEESPEKFDKWISKLELLQEFPMSDKTLNKNCKKGEIPHVYIGSKRLFNRTALERQLRKKMKGND